MTVQIIEKDGTPAWAIIPYEKYQELLDAVEMLEDIHDYDLAKQRIAAGEELIPSEVTYAILDGEHPVRVWRKYRGLTQQRLAERAEISDAYLSQIERGKRTGTPEILSRLAKALGIAIDDIIP